MAKHDEKIVAADEIRRHVEDCKRLHDELQSALDCLFSAASGDSPQDHWEDTNSILEGVRVVLDHYQRPSVEDAVKELRKIRATIEEVYTVAVPALLAAYPGETGDAMTKLVQGSTEGITQILKDAEKVLQRRIDASEEDNES